MPSFRISHTHRKRKIRCIPSENDEQVCKACSNKGQPCVFEKQSVMGRPPKNKQKDKEQPPAGSTNPSTADSSSSSPTKASNSKNARKTSIPGGGPENNGATKPNQAEPDADADVDMKRPQTAASGASVGGNARPATSEGQRPPKRKKKNSVSATKKEGEKQPDSDLSRSGATTLPPAVHLADPSKSGLPAFSGQASSSSSSSSSPSSSAHSHYHQQHYTLSGNHQEPYGGHKSTAASVNANGHPPHQEQQHYGSYNTQFLPPLTSLPGYRKYSRAPRRSSCDSHGSPNSADHRSILCTSYRSIAWRGRILPKRSWPLALSGSIATSTTTSAAAAAASLPYSFPLCPSTCSTYLTLLATTASPPTSASPCSPVHASAAQPFRSSLPCPPDSPPRTGRRLTAGGFECIRLRLYERCPTQQCLVHGIHKHTYHSGSTAPS